eukprot:NODE_45_length_27728_cov_0.328387.p16 type:complete len:177 gc:universal NODE_45_length_27728_cov_0.328387:3753-3223(-)
MRFFANELKLECFIASSFSKNFGLYSERIGCLIAACKDEDTANKVTSQFSKIIRTMNSNSPAFGARIVSIVLSDSSLFEEWQGELMAMSGRITEMRTGVKERLVKLKTPGNWEHITSQIGMFSFTGLTKMQVHLLKNKFHIYMTDNGRISMCGLTSANLDYFCESVDWVVRNNNKL